MSHHCHCCHLFDSDKTILYRPRTCHKLCKFAICKSCIAHPNAYTATNFMMLCYEKHKCPYTLSRALHGYLLSMQIIITIIIFLLPVAIPISYLKSLPYLWDSSFILNTLTLFYCMYYKQSWSHAIDINNINKTYTFELQKYLNISINCNSFYELSHA